MEREKNEQVSFVLHKLLVGSHTDAISEAKLLCKKYSCGFTELFSALPFQNVVTALVVSKNAEERLLAVFKEVENTVILANVIDVLFVKLVSAGKQFSHVVSALTSRACRDIYRAFVCSVNTYTDETLEQCREVINKTFPLELVTIQRIVSAMLSFVEAFPSVNGVNAVFEMFGELAFFKGSSAYNRMRGLFEKKNQTDLITIMDHYVKKMKTLKPAYARVDLTPRNGAIWLRELIDGSGTLDEEESSELMSPCAAFATRWFKFVRVKNATKKAVLFERVGGQDFFGFLVDQYSQRKPIARVCMDFLLYFVTVEHPDVLTPAQLKSFLDDLKKNGGYFFVKTIMLELERNFGKFLDKLSDMSKSSTDRVHSKVCNVLDSGVSHPRLLAVLLSSPVREKNIIIWRKVLKTVLSVFRNRGLQVSFDVISSSRTQ